MTSQLADISAKIKPVLKKYGVKRAGVFGSYARGDARPDSDIDLLVRFGKPMGLVAYMQFIEQMETVLGHSVDVVTEQSMSPFIRPHIEADLQTIYES